MALKTLNTLVKLHKRKVDVIRREMIALEEERKQLELLAQKLREEHAHEAEIALRDPKMAGFFVAYSKRIKQRLLGIDKEIKRLDGAIEEKAEAIRAEFSEQKKYEVAREHAKAHLAEEAKRRVQQRFDEIGAQQYTKIRDSIV